MPYESFNLAKICTETLLERFTRFFVKTRPRSNAIASKREWEEREREFRQRGKEIEAILKRRKEEESLKKFKTREDKSLHDIHKRKSGRTWHQEA